MHKFRLHQFRKNRYFYGKKLSVRDFKAEQGYFNGKRHLINRMIHGNGVVYGIQAEVKSSDELVLYPGLALDSFGQEVVVSARRELKISDIDLTRMKPVTEDIKAVLCLEYAENERELVKSPVICGAGCENVAEHNLIEEKYKLVFEDMEEYLPTGTGYYADTTVHDGDGFLVTRSAPRWVMPGEWFYIEIVVEKLSEGVGGSIQLTECPGRFFKPKDVICNKAAGTAALEQINDELKISFKTDTAGKYTGRYLVMACLESHEDEEGNKFYAKSIRIDSQEISFERKDTLVDILDKPVIDKISEEYFKNRINSTVYNGTCVPIPIVVLHLKRDDSSPWGFFLDGSTPAEPFRPDWYVYNNSLLYKLISSMDDRITHQHPLEIKSFHGNINIIDSAGEPAVNVEYNKPDARDLTFNFDFPKDVTTGIVHFDINSCLYPGDSDFSEPIDPGLGTDNFFVHVEYSKDRTKFDNMVSNDIMDYEKPRKFRLGVEKGQSVPPGHFQISYFVMESLRYTNSLNVRWWAFKNVKDTGSRRAKEFYLKKRHVILKSNESFKFWTNLSNEDASDIQWELNYHYDESIIERKLMNDRIKAMNTPFSGDFKAPPLESSLNYHTIGIICKHDGKRDFVNFHIINTKPLIETPRMNDVFDGIRQNTVPVRWQGKIPGLEYWQVVVTQDYKGVYSQTLSSDEIRAEIPIYALHGQGTYYLYIIAHFRYANTAGMFSTDEVVFSDKSGPIPFYVDFGIN